MSTYSDPKDVLKLTCHASSVQDQRFMSNTEYGVEEDQPGVHPNILNKYYGASQSQEAKVNTRIAEDQAGDI